MRKGQVTLFIIIGIVLLITVGLFLAIKPENPDITIISTDQDEVRIEFTLANCLQEVLDESIYYAAATTFFTQGTNLTISNSPIFHIQGVETFPGDVEISSRYAHYLESQMSDCINLEDITLNQDFIFEDNPYEIEVIIAEDEIKAIAELQGKLVGKKSSRTLEEVSASSKTALAPIYQATRMVTTSTIDNPFCAECLDRFAYEKGIYGIATYGPSEGTIEFTLVDFEEQLEINFLVAP